MLAMLAVQAPVGAAGAVGEIFAHKHLGPASCASSTCHGANQRASKARIEMNEYSLWQQKDPHASSWVTLGSAESRKIGAKLGIGDPREAGICLDCHIDHPPEAQRGEKFMFSDGVGCEACHGGAERWIATHDDDQRKRTETLAEGLYPTERPVARARLCLSCHMGTRERMITHRIMGAGHPRLSFELDTFTWLNPHYTIDADYVQRKGEFNGARDWAIGQGVSAINLLDILTDEGKGWAGIFPELVLFDCHACHKPMSGRTWGTRPGTGLGPGVVRLNDANLVMFRHVLGIVDQAAANDVLAATRALHQATLISREQTFGAARALKAKVEAQLDKVAAHAFGPETLGQVLASLLRDAEKGEFRDFAAAEQAALAAQSVVAAFQAAKQLSESDVPALNAGVDRVYAAVEKEDAFDRTRFVEALRSLRAAAP
ncbi:MAG: hypothetical protein IT479_00815 [Xanthomonadales bacterium]|nr:hypothetical protein [Xanthomonadales bacterium]